MGGGPGGAIWDGGGGWHKALVVSWSLSSGFYTQVVRPATSLWVQNTAKSALKRTIFG